MFSRPSHTETEPAVLISLVGDDSSFQHTERHLVQRGYRVVLAERSAFDRVNDEEFENLGRTVDSIWVVHTIGPDPAVVHNELDLASRAVGADRVGVMVESEVPARAERDGVAHRVHFVAGQSEMAAEQMVGALASMGLAGQVGVRRRMEAAQNRRFATGLAAPILMISVILAAAVVAALFVVSGLVNGDDEEAVATTSDSSTAADQPEVAQRGADPAGAEAGDPFAPVDQAPAIGGVAPGQVELPGGSVGAESNGGPSQAGGMLERADESDVGQEPAAPSLRDGTTLPDTCFLDLRKDLLLSQPTICNQGGVLGLEGPVGPWHNEVGQIIISEGVVASLLYEDATTAVTLSEGIHQLDLQGASHGLDWLQVTFTGEGQHLHLIQNPTGGNAELTLTFLLGTP